MHEKIYAIRFEEVRDRHKMYADQFAFGAKQDNTKGNLMIDTREFVEWLQ